MTAGRPAWSRSRRIHFNYVDHPDLKPCLVKPGLLGRFQVFTGTNRLETVLLQDFNGLITGSGVIAVWLLASRPHHHPAVHNLNRLRVHFRFGPLLQIGVSALVSGVSN